MLHGCWECFLQAPGALSLTLERHRSIASRSSVATPSPTTTTSRARSLTPPASPRTQSYYPYLLTVCADTSRRDTLQIRRVTRSKRRPRSPDPAVVSCERDLQEAGL